MIDKIGCGWRQCITPARLSTYAVVNAGPTSAAAEQRNERGMVGQVCCWPLALTAVPFSHAARSTTVTASRDMSFCLFGHPDDRWRFQICNFRIPLLHPILFVRKQFRTVPIVLPGRPLHPLACAKPSDKQHLRFSRQHATYKPRACINMVSEGTRPLYCPRSGEAPRCGGVRIHLSLNAEIRVGSRRISVEISQVSVVSS